MTELSLLLREKSLFVQESHMALYKNSCGIFLYANINGPDRLHSLEKRNNFMTLSNIWK